MVAFFRIDWVAGLLFLPYIAWVSTATALNAAVLRRNPEMA
jgi:tryptophan-rich sensory protein